MPRRPVILAVDDNPGNLVALEAVLERDFEVRFARSGAEAISLLERHPDVDVIILDVNMPEMDGYETASRITQMPACHDVPIVFLTATYKEDPYVKRGYEVGGIDYFTKPFDPDLLRKKMGVYASFRQRAAILAERERAVREAEELLATAKRLSVALECDDIGIVITDLDGHVHETNDAFARIRGGTELLDDDRGAVMRALQQGESSTEPVRSHQVDGQARRIQSCVSPLRDSAGAIVGAVVTVRDVTEPNNIERELETRTRRLISHRGFVRA